MHPFNVTADTRPYEGLTELLHRHARIKRELAEAEAVDLSASPRPSETNPLGQVIWPEARIGSASIPIDRETAQAILQRRIAELRAGLLAVERRLTAAEKAIEQSKA